MPQNIKGINTWSFLRGPDKSIHSKIWDVWSNLAFRQIRVNNSIKQMEGIMIWRHSAHVFSTALDIRSVEDSYRVLPFDLYFAANLLLWPDQVDTVTVKDDFDFAMNLLDKVIGVNINPTQFSDNDTLVVVDFHEMPQTLWSEVKVLANQLRTIVVHPLGKRLPVKLSSSNIQYVATDFENPASDQWFNEQFRYCEHIYVIGAGRRLLPVAVNCADQILMREEAAENNTARRNLVNSRVSVVPDLFFPDQVIDSGVSFLEAYCQYLQSWGWVGINADPQIYTPQGRFQINPVLK